MRGLRTVAHLWGTLSDFSSICHSRCDTLAALLEKFGAHLVVLSPKDNPSFNQDFITIVRAGSPDVRILSFRCLF